METKTSMTVASPAAATQAPRAAAHNERVVIPAYGPASVLKLIQEPMPVPKRGEVRIKVEAAGVSWGDVNQRSGLFYAGAPEMPYTPGYDVVGTVDAVGEDAGAIRVGSRVVAFTLFGGYARFVCVPASRVVDRVSRDLDAAKLVALVLNYTTAFQMLRRVAAVREGQSILVYGASGGVGSAVLDLARHFGVTVAAAVSKRWQPAFKEQAALLFDDHDPAARQRVREFRPDGFDAAFDAIGGSHVWRTRSLVNRNGVLVPFGIGSAVKGNGRRARSQVVLLGLLLAFAKVWRRPRVEMYAMDQRIKTKEAEIVEDIRTLTGLLSDGLIDPRIGAHFPLPEAWRAHELIESRTNAGKIVLIP